MVAIILDCHTHIMEMEHLEEATVADMKRGGLDPNTLLGPPEDHLRVVGSQVDRAVVLGLRMKNSGMMVPNDYVAQYVNAHSDRFIGFMSIDPYVDDIRVEMERCYRRLGLRGVKVSPIYQNIHPLDPRMIQIYRLAEEWGVPILLHHSPTFPRTAPLKYGDPVLLEDVALMFPDLKMIIAHLAYPWGDRLHPLVRKQPNIYTGISAISLRPFKYYLTLADMYEYSRSLRKVLFGSDWPFATPEDTLNTLRSINRYTENTNLPRIPDSEIQSIIYDNWKAVFKD